MERPFDAAILDFGGVMTEPIFRRPLGDDPGARLVRFFVVEAVSVYAEPTGDHDLHLLETGRLDETEFLRRFTARAAAAGEPSLDVEEARRALFGNGIVACAAMVDAVRAVRAGGYRTALCTNNVREWEAEWRATIPVDELFDVVVDSSAVGLRKPDPAIYLLTCERLGVAPERCVFVDDLPPNLEAAAALGITVLASPDPVHAAGELLALLRPDLLAAEEAAEARSVGTPRGGGGVAEGSAGERAR